jgi:hypothetical protein
MRQTIHGPANSILKLGKSKWDHLRKQVVHFFSHKVKVRMQPLLISVPIHSISKNLLTDKTVCMKKTCTRFNEKIRFLYIVIALLAANLIWCKTSISQTFFSQDFNSSSTLADYINASPSNGQFNSITTSGSSTATITSSALRFVRGSGTTSFTRSTNFSSTPGAIIYKFDLTVSGTPSGNAGTVARWQIGSGYNSGTNGAESDGNTYAQFAIDFRGTGNFRFNDVSNGNTSSNFSVNTARTITWVMNNSGSTISYLAPDGSTEAIANDRADIWVGTTHIFEDVVVETTGGSIQDMKFAYTSSTGTITMDNINIQALVTPQVSAFSGNSICNGGTGQLTVTTSAGTGPFRVVYNDGSNRTVTDVISATAFDAVVNPTSTTNYTLVSVAEASGAMRTSGFTDGSATITITAPTANAGGALPAICQGGTSAALGGSVGGTATGGTWDDGGVGGTFNSGPTNLNTTWTPPGAYTGTATLTLTTSGGACGTTTASKTLVVNTPAPAAAAGSDDEFCIAPRVLAANAAAPGTGTWTILAGSPSTNTSQLSSTSNPTATFTPTQSGTYTLRWTITRTGCSSTNDDVVFTVNPLPQVTAFNGTPICSGGIGQLTATLTGASPFTVTYNPGAIAEPSVESAVPFNATPNPGSTSSYTIIGLQDANGCVRNTGFTDAAATIEVSTTLTSLGYSTTTATYCPGVAITVNNPTLVGGTALSFSVNPALPAGLSLNTGTGVITGTPTASVAAADYTITATNACGSVQTDISISTEIAPLTTTPGSRCGTGIVALEAATNSSCITPTINWFAAATGGSSLGTGTNFNSPSITETTTYYAEESFTSAEATIGASASGTTNRGLRFDLYEPIVLRSVQINNTSGSGSITIRLRNSSGNAVSGVSDVSQTVASGVQTVALNWAIPAGSGYRILYQTGTRNLRRTDSYASFPKSIGVGVIAAGIDGSDLNDDRYHYFYNWVIARTRVPALATVITLPTFAVGATPAVDRGTTSADLPYSGTTGTPDEYSITWDGAALAAGFTDVAFTTLPASPIALTVPAAADATTYNGTLTVRNTTTGCISSNNSIAVTINKTNLDVTADDKNKIFDGDVFTGFTSTITGFINGENVGVVSGSATYAGAATTATAIGSHTITPVVTGLSAVNYNFVPVNGTLVIDPVGISSADFRSKANGNFSAAGTWEYDLGGDNWVDASQAPTSSNNVSITHNVVLDQNYTVGTGKNLALGGGSLIVNPTRTLTVTGTANFGGNPVTLRSTSAGTASIGQVTGSLTGATNVTVERYIPNNGFRSWRLLSVPVTGSQTIRQAWQEGTANPLPLQNNLPNYGTVITGVGNQAAAQAAGFDDATQSAALLRWNGSGWTGVTNTNTKQIASDSAYFLFIRGERSKGVAGSIANSSATTLRTTGTLYSGDQEIEVNTAFALIPNLYPSAINFSGLERTGGVSNLFYVWDSKKIQGNSLGVYQTFSNTSGFNCLIGGGSYVLGQPNTAIESGQAFFVTSSGGGTITLKESAKISGTNGSLGFRPSATPAKIDSRLYSGDDMLDGNVVVFDAAYDRAVDGDDAPKMGNPGANFAIETQSKILAVEGTQQPVHNEAVQFRMWNLQPAISPCRACLPNWKTAT